MAACLCLQFTKLAVCCGLLLSLVVHIVCTKENKPTNLFEAFFPCLPGPNIRTQENAQSCDLFTYAAVQLALERVNQSSINLSSTETGNSIGYGDSSIQVVEVLYNLYVEVNRLGKDFSEGINATKAAIGTDDNYIVGRPVVSLTGNIGVPIVSYGLTDNRLNEFSNFYRTLPSIDALNWARIKLLDQFKWYRIGILSSAGSINAHQVENFRDYFGTFVERFNIEAELAIERLTNELSSALLDLRKFDIRIMLGFFGPEESRLILCEASFLNLTTSDHVWILPSYYNPDWWKGGGADYHSNQQTRNCTDEDMMDILNSVIFIDPVKYPPMGTTLSEFLPALLKKTRELFSELDTEVPLERLLQHSRAVSAYDSTLLLAHSLSDGEINRTRLDHLIACELCRTLRTDPLLREEFQFCQNITVNCSTGSETTIPRSVLLSSYGQVLISQFVNGTHCPMALYWPINSTIPQDQDNNYFRINDLCNQTCAQEAGLDFQTISACPHTFFWKGRNSSPTSNYLLTSEVPEAALICVGVWSALCEVYIIFLIVFNLVWRENKHVKPTSPRINVLILVGIALMLPVPVIHGITTSGTRYNLENPFATILCQFGLWLSWLGESLTMVGLLVKIYRLYRIFHNKKLRIRKRLEDKYLFMSAFTLTIPVVLVLIVWNSVSFYRFMSVLIARNANLQLLSVTSCRSDNEVIDNVFSSVLDCYYGIVFLTTVALSLFTSKAPRMIKLDLAVTRISLGLGTVIVIALITIRAVTVNHPNVYELLWWSRVVRHAFGDVLIVSVLFLYQVVLVMRDYCNMSFKRSANYDLNQTSIKSTN